MLNVRNTKLTLSAYLELTKPRVTAMVMLTAAAGVYLATAAAFDSLLFFHAVLGTVLLAAGTGVLNQYLEREADSRMRRTQRRPLPSGRIQSRHAFWFGLILVVAGVAQLALFANPLTALLGLFTSAVYLLLYTPLKTKTSTCTLIGAIPGAAPPVMGWVAVRGELDIHALILFGILFGWQFPHSLAIAWIYRSDYRRGGFRMLPENDAGLRPLILGFCLFLLCVSLTPVFTGLAGGIYFWGAVVLGLGFLWFGKGIGLRPSNLAAGRLVRASIIYLPLLFSLMIVDKV
jgi:protoheme IX farnesyltransferase